MVTTALEEMEIDIIKILFNERTPLDDQQIFQRRAYKRVYNSIMYSARIEKLYRGGILIEKKQGWIIDERAKRCLTDLTDSDISYAINLIIHFKREAPAVAVPYGMIRDTIISGSHKF